MIFNGLYQLLGPENLNAQISVKLRSKVLIFDAKQSQTLYDYLLKISTRIGQYFTQIRRCNSTAIDFVKTQRINSVVCICVYIYIYKINTQKC